MTKKETSLLEAARLIACPVTLLTALSKGEDRAMISSISYANLEPLILTTTLARTSNTGRTILESRAMAVSLIAEQDLDKVEKLSTSTATDKLKDAGFSIGRLENGLAYAVDALAVFDVEIIEQVQLEKYIAVMARVHQVLINDRDAGAALPLIRYNRSWTTINRDSLQKGLAIDHYPV